jgi:sugar phosphate isomerase/epimerase
MRLGGPLFQKYGDAEEWVRLVRANGYRAAYCPVGTDAPEDEIRRYERAAHDADIVIAEVGAWSNPLSSDEGTRRAALDQCKRGLALAEAIGARCCVNIAGSRGKKWDGPCPLDVEDETVDMIVATVRDIIDSVRPRRTFYTLEPMPWMFPDSTDSYLALLKAIDRPAFAVHFDPVNMINCPRLYFATGAFIRDFIRKLGPHIKSCHAKDILLQDRLTVHLDEVRPGCGALDYPVYLKELAGLADDVPLMLEHLPDEAEFTAAAAHIRQVAQREGVAL